MAITDWPTHERPREKLLARGAGALSDAELLAIFLRTGVAGKTAVDLARELLTRFGSLRTLLNASQDAFCASTGLGMAKFVQLQAALEMTRRQLGETLQKGRVLSSPRDTENYLHAQLGDRAQEVFCCLFLDNRHRVLALSIRRARLERHQVLLGQLQLGLRTEADLRNEKIRFLTVGGRTTAWVPAVQR